MDALAQVRELLPGWVGWAGPAVYVAFALLATALCLPPWAWLLLRPLRKAEAAAKAAGGELHWTERARYGWAARRAFSLTVLLQGAILGASSLLWAGPFARISVMWLGLLVGALVALVGMEVYRRRLLPAVIEQRVSLGYLLSGVLTVLLVLRPILPLAFVAALLAPEQLLSWQTLVWLALTLAATLATHFGAMLQLARLLGVVRRAPARLQAIVDQAAAEQGIRPKGVYLLRWGMSNALALPLAQLLAFSDRALAVHSDEHLAAITAHELGHLSEPARVRWTRAGASLLFVGLALSPTIVREHGYLPVVGLVVTLLVVSVLLRRLSQRMEARADAHAHQHGNEPGGYAEALEALYRVNGLPAVLAAKGTHPHLYDRLLATGHQPGYDRPPPPPRGGLAWVLVSFIASLVVVMTLSITAQLPDLFTDDHELAANWRLSTGVHDGSGMLSNIASQRMVENEPHADLFFDAAEQLSDAPSEIIAGRVLALANADRCDDAQTQLLRASRLLGYDALQAEPWRYATESLGECLLRRMAPAADDALPAPQIP